MKCLIAFREHPSDVIFIDYDEEFREYLYTKLNHDKNEPLDHSLIYHHFQVYITIQDIMSTEGNDIEGVSCTDGLSFVFHSFDGIKVVAVDEKPTNAVYNRCLVFEKLTKLHLGPASLFLKPSNLELRDRLWGKLKSYLNKWEDVIGLSDVYSTKDTSDFQRCYEELFKQHFLFESIEHLHVNHTLKSQAETVLQGILDLARVNENKCSQAILLVQGKVFVSCTNGFQENLDPSDMLFILFLSHIHNEKFHQQTLFLNLAQREEHYFPCNMTSLPISDGITLVLLGEISTAIAPNICRAINNLQTILLTLNIAEEVYNKTNELKVGTALNEFNKNSRVIEFYLQRIQTFLAKSKAECQNITSEWVSACNAVSDLVSESDTRYFFNFSRHVTRLIHSLRCLFYETYCSDTNVSPPLNSEEIVMRLRRSLRDSSAYLLVRAQRNFIIGSYMVNFPGIVHFLLIDRSQNRVLAPSIEGEGPSARYCHEITVTLHRLYQRFVRQIVTCAYIRKRDLLYGYRIVFVERETKQIVKPYIQEDLPSPGIQGKMMCSLYTDLMEKYFPVKRKVKVTCYELLTVYVGDLPLEYVSDCNKRLFVKLLGEMANN